MDELVEREFRALRDLITEKERHLFDIAKLETQRHEADMKALNERMDHLNEFKQAMADQASRFILRAEFDAARGQLEERNDVARAYTDQQIGALKETRGSEAQVIDARLTRMSDARQILETNLKDCIKREEFEDAKQAGLERFNNNRNYVDSQFESKLAPIYAQIQHEQKPNWAALTVGASLVIAAVAGMWLIIGLKIDAAVAPMALALEQVKVTTTQNAERVHFMETGMTTVIQNSTVSVTDRAQLNERMRHLEEVLPTGASTATEVANLKQNWAAMTDRLQQVRATQAAQQAALIEVETQFCGQDNLRSQIHAQDLRTSALIWQKVFGAPLPIANTFYAHVGRCGAPATGTGG